MFCSFKFNNGGVVMKEKRVNIVNLFFQAFLGYVMVFLFAFFIEFLSAIVDGEIFTFFNIFQIFSIGLPVAYALNLLIHFFGYDLVDEDKKLMHTLKFFNAFYCLMLSFIPAIIYTIMYLT